MSVNYMVKAIYDERIHDVTKSPEKWKAVLRLSANLYRFEFDNILMIYAQKPHAELCADYDTWKKVDRFVKRGSKGIAIFPSRALNPRMKYVFDISDTGGRNSQLTWSLDGDTLKDYLDYLVSEGQIRYPVMEGATSDNLNKAIGHLPETAGIGATGNCVLAGHNGSRHGTFFTHLNEISKGDLVTLMNADGEVLNYEVTDFYVVGPYDNSIKDQREEAELTLFTCAEKGSMRFVVKCIMKEDE